MEERQRKTCTVEADLELVRRYQNGDPQALDDLFKTHRRLIMFWVRVWSWADREEVMQEARIGFSKAATEFDSRNDDFHAQARNSVMRTIFESSAIRPVKRTLYTHYRLVMNAQDRLMQKLDRRPTLEELSDETQLSLKQIENALNVIAAFPLPLEREDGQLAIEEPYQIEDPYQSQLLREAIGKLSPYQKQIIIRFYIYGQTDGEIAADFGSSTDAIKMKRRRALKKLRDIISDEGV